MRKQLPPQFFALDGLTSLDREIGRLRDQFQKSRSTLIPKHAKWSLKQSTLNYNVSSPPTHT